MATELSQGRGAPQFAFVFNNVAGAEELLSAFRADVEVHVLDASHDGLAQIATILKGRSNVEALHIVGHGSVGSLNLGSFTLDAGNDGWGVVLRRRRQRRGAGGEVRQHRHGPRPDVPRLPDRLV